MLSDQPPRFAGHWRCGGRDMFLVVEGQDSRCSCLNPPLLCISKAHGMKAHGMSY